MSRPWGATRGTDGTCHGHEWRRVAFAVTCLCRSAAPVAPLVGDRTMLIHVRWPVTTLKNFKKSWGLSKSIRTPQEAVRRF